MFMSRVTSLARHDGSVRKRVKHVLEMVAVCIDFVSRVIYFCVR